MFIKVKLIARRIRTVSTFESADPWNGGSPSRFSLDLYKMLPEHIQDPRDFREGTLHTWGTPDRYGLRSEIDGAVRMLPTFLAEQWLSGSVAAERLPLALHGIEPELAKRDYRTPPKKLVGKMGAVGAALAVIGGLGLWAVSPVALRAASASRPLRLSVPDFLKAHLAPGESCIVQGLVPLVGREPAPASLPIPDEVARAGGRSWSIGWLKAAGGHRAVLIPSRTYETRAGIDIGYAAVLAPESLGLGATLAAIKTKVPDLQTATILASRWIVPARAPTAMIVRAVCLLLTGLGIAIVFGVSFGALLAAPQRRRNEMLAGRVCANLGASPVAAR